jgi:hypothetical protein
MFCNKCGKAVDEGANYCSNCGECVSSETPSFKVETGDSSVNIGVGNLPNANIHIGDRITKNVEHIHYELHKTSNTKLPFKASWAVFAGTIGFLGSIASIYSTLSNGLFSSVSPKPWLFPVFSISTFLLIFGILLAKNQFVWAQFFGFVTDKNGYIRFIRLKGKCPLCTGNLSVRYSGTGGRKSIGAICSVNPDQHRFTFDPTWLDRIS